MVNIPTRQAYKPTHPGLFHVEFSGESGEYSSCLRTEKSFSKGQVICPLVKTIPAPVKAYSSVQVGKGSQDHIELESDLVYVNHSCDPNVAFELPKDRSRWLVRALTDIPQGEALTFAYYSTEWDMAQPFDCICGTSKCLGRIQGARYIPMNTLTRDFINEHILELKQEQQTAEQNNVKPTNGHAAASDHHRTNGHTNGFGEY
ncbi:uncharacterized protein L969DRAFT_97214 [Mixia osmundae IAM 14324]|uniref:Post-SET domain-containing protein n=1 Tax=Mixia osmundae (strain CBS 9802 / IAM 14324 / JCM 22182 / KY 12970) TaxID=764103 RepID=G7DW17_MIXOS|nr:uncharacterized protein L969DRAFT_97214 [Mixia osmundae IAM 14324]KEI36477.1 hypothetical protein L969DRAFT_97214 [Mixia osmundae IAM 14324]GAA94823.1 hypothetical protein E5Q_01477 [Mixia osmundae IAM 14324]